MSVQIAVREAEPADGDAIRAVARRSLRTSYSLSPGTIDSAVDQWYGSGTLERGGGQTSPLLLVATVDGEVGGYSESVFGDDGGRGDIQWLHVAPDRRGRGVGRRLLERTRDELADRGADHLRGRVLADNREGNSFYEREGFEMVGTETVELGSRTLVENIYVDTDSPGVRAVTLADGEQVYVDATTSISGSQASFAPVFTDVELENRYGFFCSNCRSLANAMDSMGRVQCSECGNVRTPTRWDAVYL